MENPRDDEIVYKDVITLRRLIYMQLNCKNKKPLRATDDEVLK
jgi:hypothetical protein